MKTEESVIKAEEIDGYRGGEDLESLLQFIESKPKNQQSSDLQQISSKAKRSRRIERKSKRSRTPSVTTPNQEKSPDVSVSQKTSRASSASAHHAMNPEPELSKMEQSPAPDSVTTVKNSLIVKKTTSNSMTKAKPKKQAGWLVDFNNYDKSNHHKSRVVKSKPPSGQAPLSSKAESMSSKKVEEKEIDSLSDCDTEQAHSVQDSEVISTPEASGHESEVLQDPEDSSENPSETVVFKNKETLKMNPSLEKENHNNRAVESNDVCFNYASILKFIKHGKYFFKKVSLNLDI